MMIRNRPAKTNYVILKKACPINLEIKDKPNTDLSHSLCFSNKLRFHVTSPAVQTCDT